MMNRIVLLASIILTMLTLASSTATVDASCNEHLMWFHVYPNDPNPNALHNEAVINLVGKETGLKGWNFYSSMTRDGTFKFEGMMGATESESGSIVSYWSWSPIDPHYFIIEAVHLDGTIETFSELGIQPPSESDFWNGYESPVFGICYKNYFPLIVQR